MMKLSSYLMMLLLSVALLHAAADDEKIEPIVFQPETLARGLTASICDEVAAFSYDERARTSSLGVLFSAVAQSPEGIQMWANDRAVVRQTRLYHAEITAQSFYTTLIGMIQRASLLVTIYGASKVLERKYCEYQQRLIEQAIPGIQFYVSVKRTVYENKTLVLSDQQKILFKAAQLSIRLHVQTQYAMLKSHPHKEVIAPMLSILNESDAQEPSKETNDGL